MKNRVYATVALTILLAIGTAARGQCRLEKMELATASLPIYVDLARKALIQGDVVLTFDVNGDGLASPTNIRVVSGNRLLGEGTKAELSTWKLFIPGQRLHERNCRTTFRYSLSEKRVSGAPDLDIRFHGLSIVEIHTDPPKIVDDQPSVLK